MDTYANDLATHCSGGGEVARYIRRFGTRHIVQIALVAAISPMMLKTYSNPEDQPIEVFHTMRAAVAAA